MAILDSIAIVYGLDFELLRVGNLGRGHEDRSWVFYQRSLLSRDSLNLNIPIGQLLSSPFENDHCAVSI